MYSSHLNASAFFFLAGVALPAAAAVTPSQMMANVYHLTEAAAVLKVCIESPAYGALPSEKAQQLKGLAGRLSDLVQNIAKHYKDETLLPTFDATRARISSEYRMQSYVKTKYQYCGDQLLRDMEAYVVENEKLINGYLTRQSPGKGK